MTLQATLLKVTALYILIADGLTAVVGAFIVALSTRILQIGLKANASTVIFECAAHSAYISKWTFRNRSNSGSWPVAFNWHIASLPSSRAR